MKKSGFFVLIPLLVFSQNLSFTTQPSLTQNGSNQWSVNFGVSQATDVEVSIVNPADSSVVRHLAAGVLGAAAPAPLAANVLTQNLAWDGKDDLGNVVSNPSALVARVRAGMSVSLNRLIGENPYVFKGEGGGYFNFFGISSDAAGDVYLYGTGNNQSSYAIRQYDGGGVYKKTVFPYPTGLSAGEVAGYGVNTWPDGHYSPKLPSSPWGKDLGVPIMSKTIISSGGTLFPSVANGEITVITIPTLNYMKVKTNGGLVGDGSTKPLVVSPQLPGYPTTYYIGGPINFCFSPDNKFVYLSGIYEGNFLSGFDMAVDTGFWVDGQVFKVDLATGKATSWLKLDSIPKDLASRKLTIGPQTDYAALRSAAAIHGVATDDSGHVFICDRFHQRIGVYDTNGTYLGGIPVKHPDHVAVNKYTGEIYVVTRTLTGYHVGIVSIFKYSDWRNGGTLKASLPNFITNVGQVFGAPYAEKVYLAVKQSPTQPVLWFASNSSAFDPSENSIWAFRDDGDKFTIIRDFYQIAKGVNVGFDRIAVDRRNDVVYVQDGWSGIRKIEDWANPQLLPCSTSTGARISGTDLTVSPTNMLYVREGSSYSGSVTRYTLDHRHAPVNYANSGKNVLTPYIYGRFGLGYGEKGLAVNKNDQVAIMWMYTWMKYFVSRYDNQATIDTAQGTALINPIPAECGGIKYDYQGNLYVGIGVRGSDHVIPTSFTGDYGYTTGVGAVVKYPAGGTGSISESGLGVVTTRTVTGASKIYKPGFGALSYNCWCQSARFDVDPYGRLFIPNSVTNQVTVVDNTGNPIVQFGEYGNVDSRGPGIPLAYPMGAAASEDYIYVTDFANARLAQVRMSYTLDNLPGLTGHNVSVTAASVPSKALAGLWVRPNPFRTGVRITVPAGQVALKAGIYNVAGGLVRELTLSGRDYHWDGTLKNRQRAPAGTYVFRLQTRKGVLAEKVVLAR